MAVAAVVPLTAVMPAHASSADDDYVRVLNNEGVGHRTSQDHLIQLGHAVCSDLDHGKSVENEMDDIYGHVDLSQKDVATIVGAAIYVYCPWHKAEYDALG